MHIWTRLLQINAALWGWLAWYSFVRLGLLKSTQAPEERLARVLEGLGTTFVKLGQGLSLHRELLPDAFVRQLQRLQDHVEPFGAALAREEVLKSFGQPPESLFSRYEDEPFAAGSIAQVHRATMPDGRPVVVKIRRPGIRRMVNEDIRILRWFVTSVLWLQPRARRFRPHELIEELSRNLHKEIDFRQEATNIQRFVEMFRDAPDIYVPAVVDGLYTGWVMVQEMSMGSRIDAPELQADGPRLASTLVDAYLRQFFHEGVFHGDPHPGNLFVLADGRVCLHDFGLVGFLDRSTRLNLVAFMLAFAQQDVDWVLDAFAELGMLAPGFDRRELRAGLEEILQDYVRKPLRDWSFGEAFLRVARLGGGDSARVPHQLLVLLRTVFLLESTVRRLDPEFNLLEGLFARAGEVFRQSEAAAPVPALDRMKFEGLLFTRQAPRTLGRLAHEVRSVLQTGSWPVRSRATAASTDAGLRRVACALLAVGLYAIGTWLLVSRAGPVLLGLPLLPGAAWAAAVILTWESLRKVEQGQ